MYDNALFFSGLAEKRSGILKKYDLEDREFILSTIHRDLNTDKPERLQSIFTALLELGDRVDGRLIVPLHPRTLKMLVRLNDKDFISDIRTSGRIQILPPVSFLDMIMLEKHCSMIITDSGGVQKESYFYQKPCIILRPETEWTEIVEHGSAIIADADRDRIIAAYEHFSNNPPSGFPPLYGDGKAAWFILDKLMRA
jgi:UDP-GlcNAc3NAcA epimerase